MAEPTVRNDPIRPATNSSEYPSSIPFIPVIPQPQAREKFDGRHVSAWLEKVENTYDQLSLPDERRIKDLPNWTDEYDIRRKVKTALRGKTTWEEAKQALKLEFKARDPKQFQSWAQKLKDLAKGPILSSPLDILDYIQNFSSTIIEAEESRTMAIKEDEYVEAILNRLNQQALKDIMIFSGLTWAQMKKLSY
ncbi:hypothetical protein F4776DRAFT_598071 [Hypoxylon sp. NC0597]|nr:hypothetical protein F4776DRAFT_598071 [Hypoxylon sp. NC0597]